MIKSLEYNTCQFGKENIRNSVKEIFNRGSSSYKRQLQRLKMNKFIFSFFDKQIKKAEKQISCWLRPQDYKHIPVMATQ